MTTTSTVESVESSRRPNWRRLLTVGSLAGVFAAACTSGVAAIARSADVSLEVDGTTIPIAAFALWTLVGAAVGVVLARCLRRHWFAVVTSVATGLSLIPAVLAPDDTATRAVLVAAHLLAAAILVPALIWARRFPTGS